MSGLGNWIWRRMVRSARANLSKNCRRYCLRRRGSVVRLAEHRLRAPNRLEPEDHLQVKNDLLVVDLDLVVALAGLVRVGLLAPASLRRSMPTRTAHSHGRN